MHYKTRQHDPLFCTFEFKFVRYPSIARMTSPTLVSTVTSPKSLHVLSRSAINKIVRLENIDSLPLPLSLADECFTNAPLDRSVEPIPPPCRSPSPCEKGCCTYPNYYDVRNATQAYKIPRWSQKAQSECDVHLMYRSTLPDLATDADWLALPDRETLLRLYQTECSPHDPKVLEACLNTLRFDPETGLGDVHEWVRRFLYHRYRHGWYHLSVVAGCTKSFLAAIKNVPLVALPYGCVSDGGASLDAREQICLQKHQRRMIVAVQNDDVGFGRALNSVGFGTKPYFGRGSSFEDHGNASIKIFDVEHFVNAIAYVSRPKFRGGRNFASFPDRHYVLFNPMIWHAVWWMLLLVPNGCSDDVARYRVYVGGTGRPTTETITREGKRRFYPSAELGIENCVVRFEPFHACIGDPVENLKKHIAENRAFAFWFGGQVLNVADVPSSMFSDREPKRQFVKWCVSRKMNTLLNLNGNGWVNTFSDSTPFEDGFVWENDGYLEDVFDNDGDLENDRD